MAEIVIIAAVDRNMAIGNKGGLLCHLPADLKHFKNLTTGHTVIMGRRTFESLPKGALPDRRNIVVSRTARSLPGCEVVEDLNAAIGLLDEGETAYAMGGAMLYESALPFASAMELTFIDHSFQADVFFPVIDFSEWTLAASEKHDADERNPFPFEYRSYKRKDCQSPVFRR